MSESKIFKKKGGVFLRLLLSFFKMITAGFCIIALSYILIAGYGFITTCDYFAVDNIVINNSNILTKKKILKQTGIKKGDNILSINIAKAVQTLLAHPWIEQAEIKRELPRNIIITVKEENPIAIAVIGKKYILNDKGKIIKEKEHTDTIQLPIILGLDFSDINAKLNREKLLLKSIIEILNSGNKCEELISKNNIDKIHIDKEIGFIILGKSKVKKIKLGYGAFNLKCKRLKKVISSFENYEKFDFIDLTNLNRIVVKPIL
ncbi:MAG: FtsQ-type POTRA domain-containing protein [Deltaproteobacteria bacterium]|nr:FtsQ-type POTRA domain-containing protein [Deltaproteobacteria bacterium]